MKAKRETARQYRAWVLPVLGKSGQPWRFYPAYYTRRMILENIKSTSIYKADAEAVPLVARAERHWLMVGPKRRAKPKPVRARARRTK